jgi:hypothetical protein
MWSDAKGMNQFISYAQNILDRRMKNQDAVPVGSFTQCLRDELVSSEVRTQVAQGIQRFRSEVERHQSKQRYAQWLARADQYTSDQNLDSLLELYVTRILLVRDESKRQLSLDLTLTEEELEDRDSSQVRNAAELFMHEELGIPYYFGFERLCVMATSNVEELLGLAAALYVGLQAKQVLRKSEPILSPLEQEKLLREAAARKRDFIPKSHTEGTRAQRLLDSIGAFCYDQTFAPNAPYAPGVTGVRLSRAELVKLNSPHLTARRGWSCNACWQSVPPRIFWFSGKARPPGSRQRDRLLPQQIAVCPLRLAAADGGMAGRFRRRADEMDGASSYAQPQEPGDELTCFGITMSFAVVTRVHELWDDLLKDRPVKLLYIAGRGFDVRAQSVMRDFVAGQQGAGRQTVSARLLLLGFHGYELDDDVEALTQENAAALEALFSRRWAKR